MSGREYPVLIVCEPDRLDRIVALLRPTYEVAAVDGRDRLDEALARSDVVVWADSTPRLVLVDDWREPRDRADEGLLVAVSHVEADGSVVHCARAERVERFDDPDALVERIGRIRLRASYDELLAEYAELAERRGAMEADFGSAHLEDAPEYEEVCDRIDAVLAELDALATEFEPRDYVAAFGAPDFSGRSRIGQAILSS